MKNRNIKKVILLIAIILVVIAWNKLFAFLDHTIPTFEGRFIFLKYWTRYLILSFPLMIFVGKILRDRDDVEVIHIIKIVSAVVMAGLSALIIIEARWGVVRVFDTLAKGDGLAGFASFVVIGSIAIFAMYFCYVAIAALTAGMTAKQILEEITF